jgi:adenine phosphoribosyltransferase
MPAAGLEDYLDRLVRDVPDFPQPGVVFKDLTPLLADPDGFASVVDSLVAGARAVAPDVVVGIEARGFILAAPVAYLIGAGFVPARKPGKLPRDTYTEGYDLEYGTQTLELHTDSLVDGARVLVVDDVLATGGTAAATSGLVSRAGGVVVAVSVVLELGFLAGRDRLGDIRVDALRTL